MCINNMCINNKKYIPLLKDYCYLYVCVYAWVHVCQVYKCPPVSGKGARCPVAGDKGDVSPMTCDNADNWTWVLWKNSA